LSINIEIYVGTNKIKLSPWKEKLLDNSKKIAFVVEELLLLLSLLI
jgi:hypothetical protein